MLYRLIVLGTVALLAGCVTAASQFENEMPIGTVVTEKVETPQGDVLLPAGEWTVVGKSIFRNNNYHPFAQVALANISSDNVLEGMIFYGAALENHMNYGFVATGACDGKPSDIFSRKTSNADLGNQKCLKVQEFNTVFESTPNDHLAQTETYLTSHAVQLPDTMVFATYHIVRRDKYLDVDYGFNYRLPADKVLPGYTPQDRFTYDYPYGTALWKSNLEKIVSWAREKEDLIATTYLD
ncbi:hypothetical protein LPB41_20500 [Thalassospira sp. MA62]|nr:hypothetical protein [Thalassospira sp. MA62]